MIAFLEWVFRIPPENELLRCENAFLTHNCDGWFLSTQIQDPVLCPRCVRIRDEMSQR